MRGLQLLVTAFGLICLIMTACGNDLRLPSGEQAGSDVSMQEVDVTEQQAGSDIALQDEDVTERTTEMAPQEILRQMAESLPEDIGFSINRSTVEDWNGDGVPEVYLSGSSGWGYAVFYGVDGEMHALEDLEPWTWTSDLCYTESGNLLLYCWAHTTGTAGNCQHRIYEWTSEGYRFKEDLWCLPAGHNEEGEPDSFIYLLSEKAIDPFPFEEDDFANLRITKEAYDQEIEDLGQWYSVFNSGCFWETDWWVERQDRDSQEVTDEVHQTIQRQILNWQ